MCTKVSLCIDRSTYFSTFCIVILLYFLKTFLSCEPVEAPFYCLLRVYSCLHLFSLRTTRAGIGTKTVLKQRMQFVCTYTFLRVGQQNKYTIRFELTSKSRKVLI